MASLTPGVLSKLLQNVDNADAKVAGEHRSALLQVIGIVPSLSGADNDGDPWKSKGFYLRVSDSVHSAYVSVSESDTELILNDTIQLGQFVHVSRLDSGSPVPVLRGLKPVPKRRPCVGDPKDLISSEALQIRNRVDFSKKGRKAEAKPKPKPNPNPNPKVESRRISLGNGKIEGLDQLRRLSLDPARKAWDRSPTAQNGVPGLKSKQSLTPSLPSTPVHSSRKSFSEKELTLERPNSNISSPLKNKNVIVSEKLISKPLKKDLKSSFEVAIPSQFNKVPVSCKTWSDTNILWDSVPPKIHNLGKEVIYHRNVGYSCAVHALEETSVLEGILQCLSVFAEMCESAQQDSATPLVEQFLNLYQSILQTAGAINSLLDSFLEEKSGNLGRGPSPLLDTSKSFKNKNAALWVQAAIDCNLSKFSLFRKEDQKDHRYGDKTHFIVLENSPLKTQEEHHLPENKQSTRNLGAAVSNSSAKTIPFRSRQRVITTKKPAVERVEWLKGHGLKEAANLAEKLLSVSRAWFLNYLEDSLDKGFGLRKGEEGSEITSLLGQLKSVNEWLDDLVGDGSRMDERVECLRKKLYKFLLDNVDSAIVQAGDGKGTQAKTLRSLVPIPMPTRGHTYLSKKN